MGRRRRFGSMHRNALMEEIRNTNARYSTIQPYVAKDGIKQRKSKQNIPTRIPSVTAKKVDVPHHNVKKGNWSQFATSPPKREWQERDAIGHLNGLVQYRKDVLKLKVKKKSIRKVTPPRRDPEYTLLTDANFELVWAKMQRDKLKES